MFDNEIKIFSSRDKIRNELLEYCKRYLNLSDADLNKTSYLSYLINILSINIANLMFYNSSLYNEFFLTKAKQKDTVLNLAQMFGYPIEAAKPSKVSATFIIPLKNIKVNGKAILHSLGKYGSKVKPFKLVSLDGIVFSLLSDIHIIFNVSTGKNSSRSFISCNIYSVSPSGKTEKISYDIINVQGDDSIVFNCDLYQLEEVLYRGVINNLEPYQFFMVNLDLSGKFLSEVRAYTSKISIREFDEYGFVSSYDVWKYYPSLFLTSYSEKAFTYKLSENSVRVMFGNGVVGEQPKNGDLVVVSALVTTGERGNLLSGGINTSVTLNLIPTSGFSDESKVFYYVPCRVINFGPATGGKNYPSIDEIRRGTISYLQSNKRLVTYDDYRNIKDIAKDIDIGFSFPVLKRSDLKINEVCIFSDLRFGEYIVPTITSSIVFRYEPGFRNMFINRWHRVSGDYKAIKYNDIIDVNDNSFYLYTESEFLSNIIVEWEDMRKESYNTIFDMSVDISNSRVDYWFVYRSGIFECSLLYSDFDRPVIEPERIRTEITPFNEVLMYIDAKVLDERLIYLDKNTMAMYPKINCFVDIEGLNDFIKMDVLAVDYSERTIGRRTVTYFKRLPKWNEFKDGVLRTNIIFHVDEEYSNLYTEYLGKRSEWTSMVSVVKKLDGVMYSGCKRYYNEHTKTHYFVILDVPMVPEWFMKRLMEENSVSIFENFVLNKFLNLDLREYKIMNTFVNMKFSNTTGKLTNMNRFNKVTKPYIIDLIDPDNLPRKELLFDGLTIAITNFEKRKVWDIIIQQNEEDSEYRKNMLRNIIKDKAGFLIVYKDKGDRKYWMGPIWLQVDDILLYDPTRIPSQDRYFKTGRLVPVKLIFNGEKLVPMVKNIPLKIRLSVWCKVTDYTDEYIIKSIKSYLYESFKDSFGYDKNIYLNEISKVVEQLWFVEKCIVTEPNHNIIFNYDISELTTTELQLYSPELVYFVPDTIQVDIMRKS